MYSKVQVLTKKSETRIQIMGYVAIMVFPPVCVINGVKDYKELLGTVSISLEK